jgi:hypothetical protein
MALLLRILASLTLAFTLCAAPAQARSPAGSFQLAAVTTTGGGKIATSGPVALSVNGTPVFTATQNSPYSGFTISGSGGTAPYVYSSVGAALPTGITINSGSGLFAGTPTVAGTFTGIILRATDAVLATADLASFTLTVAASGGGCTDGQLDFSCASNSALTTLF